MERFDIVIAGAGAAGLSLACHLAWAGVRGQSILLIDRAPKRANDRTWCFWEAGAGPFEAAVDRSWERVAFHAPGWSTTLDIAPFRYKMIRGADFYRYAAGVLADCPNVSWRYGEVESITESGDEAVARIDGRDVRGRWLFTSLLLEPPPRNPSRYHSLLQHFEGWEIETAEPRFDPGAATLMDFRIPQRGQARFCYVLPSSSRRALVEFTVFSPALLPRPEYAAELRAYLQDFLGIRHFETLHQEFGAIPMTDAPFLAPGRRVIPIGTAGGRTKPSTGYTFQRIQSQSRAIAGALADTGRPFYRDPRWRGRYSLYDGVLLNILEKGRYPGWRVFAELFQRNRASTVLRFLDETTSLAEDAGVLASTHWPPFVAATLDVLRRRHSRVNPGAGSTGSRPAA
jgi:lycopene beta-cyclase